MVTLGIPNISTELEESLSAAMVEVEELLRQQIEGKYPLVVETSRHLVQAGGKRLRPLLTLITSHYGDPHKRGILEAAVVCELTHLATFVSRRRHG
jgi:heptaprenyl diphosphate synthase